MLQKVNRYPKIYWKSRDSKEAKLSFGSKKSGKEYFLTKPFDSLPGEFPEKIYPKKIEKAEEPLKPSNFPKVKSVTYFPEYPEWERNILEAKISIEKVVLARRVTLTFDGDLDPFTLFSALLRDNAYQFYIEPRNGLAFFGVSPERLYYRMGSEVFSEAVAGTRAKGELLKRELLSDPKELAEFEFVKRDISEKLAPFLEKVNVSDTGVIDAKNVQHLYAKLSGVLKNSTDEMVINSLHPTAATLGYPKAESRSFLEKNEPFSRGLYAGGFGMITPESADMAVAIRSALFQNGKLHIYSGTGIVEKSVPEKEWQELDLKIQPFREILCF